MTLPLVVVKGSKVPLLGRNWLEHIKLNWSEAGIGSGEKANRQIFQVI